MEKIEEFIDKLEDNIRWWKRAMETDGFESDEEGSYRRDLENTKKELFNLILEELDKAREEGRREVIEEVLGNKVDPIYNVKVYSEKEVIKRIFEKLNKFKDKDNEDTKM